MEINCTQKSEDLKKGKESGKGSNTPHKTAHSRFRPHDSNYNQVGAYSLGSQKEEYLEPDGDIKMDTSDAESETSTIRYENISANILCQCKKNKEERVFMNSM